MYVNNVNNDLDAYVDDVNDARSVNGDNNRPYSAFTDALQITSPSAQSRTDTPMSNATRTNGNRFVISIGNDVINVKNNYVGDMDNADDAITLGKEDTDSAQINNCNKYVNENDTVYITLPSQVDSNTDVLNSNYNSANVTDMQ